MAGRCGGSTGLRRATGAPRGSILFQGGRGDIIEKYLESFAHWHERGWNITAFDWRGQGGSGRLSPDPHVGHATDFGAFIADLKQFWAEWAPTAPGPRVIMGHSMGGHLILRALAEGAITPDAAVLIAPMLGLHAPFGWAGWASGSPICSAGSAILRARRGATTKFPGPNRRARRC